MQHQHQWIYGCASILLSFFPTPWSVDAPRDWAIELWSCQSFQHHGQRPVPGDAYSCCNKMALTHSHGSSHPGAIDMSAIWYFIWPFLLSSRISGVSDRQWRTPGFSAEGKSYEWPDWWIWSWGRKERDTCGHQWKIWKALFFHWFKYFQGKKASLYYSWYAETRLQY